jgi:branched-chain amino acid transport system ATP-binding protein
MRACGVGAAVGDAQPGDGLSVFPVARNAYHAVKLAHRGYVMVNGEITLPVVIASAGKP